MVRIGRRVLRGLPHHHNAEEQQEVVDAPDGFVDATLHHSSQSSQPLILPNGVSVIVHYDVAEADQRHRRQHHARNEQIAQFREDLQLDNLFLFRQLLHRVHQALEDPEVRQGVHATSSRSSSISTPK